jgi:hypothetical protein
MLYLVSDVVYHRCPLASPPPPPPQSPQCVTLRVLYAHGFPPLSLFPHQLTLSIRKQRLDVLAVCQAVLPCLCALAASPAHKPAVAALIHQWLDDLAVDAAFATDARAALGAVPTPFSVRLVRAYCVNVFYARCAPYCVFYALVASVTPVTAIGCLWLFFSLHMLTIRVGPFHHSFQKHSAVSLLYATLSLTSHTPLIEATILTAACCFRDRSFAALLRVARRPDGASRQSRPNCL